jgi:hypothetical protein
MSRLELEDPAIETMQCPNRVQPLPAGSKGSKMMHSAVACMNFEIRAPYFALQ